MSDLISRQAAIDAVSRGCQAFWIFAECEKNLNALPPAERHGRWLEHQEGKWIYAKCSVCNTVRNTPTNYCPNCGAKMDGDTE